MNAIEFVKKFGWVVAKDLANRDKTSIGYLSVEHCGLNQDDLKRLVESWELVEKVGGMDKAKLLLRMRIAAELYDLADEIEKAIADVENCK